MRRLVTVVVLGLALWACCAPVVRWLSDSAPMIRWKLSQTVRSLPAAPEGTDLLDRGDSSDSGSDCNAYCVVEMYGTNRPFNEVKRYYEQALTVQGWNLLPEGSSGLDIGFKRGRDELLELLVGEWLSLYRGRLPDVSDETLARYGTVYILLVTRTCGRVDLEQL